MQGIGGALKECNERRCGLADADPAGKDGAVARARLHRAPQVWPLRIGFADSGTIIASRVLELDPPWLPRGEDAARACAGFEGHLDMLAAALDGLPIRFPVPHFLAARNGYNKILEG